MAFIFYAYTSSNICGVYQVEIDKLIFNQTAKEALYYPALELLLVTDLRRFHEYQLTELSSELLLPRAKRANCNRTSSPSLIINES